jgi:alpha-mannosidase
MIDNERKLYESRIDVFILRLKRLFYEDKVDLEVTYRSSGSGEKFSERLNGKYKPVDHETIWGENWQRAWFHLKCEVPDGWKGKYVIARINLGGEGLVFDTKGMPVCGLSVHTLWPTYEFWRDRIDISSSANGGERVEFWAEGSAGQLFGVPLKQDDGDQAPVHFGKHKAIFQYAELAVFRKDIWDLYLDVYVLQSLMKALPEKSVRRKRILYTVNRAIDQFNSDPGGTKKARRLLQPEFEKKATASDLKTRAVGHAHLDTAWLWPLHETIRKCARTFSSQIALLEKYPDYVFGASQPQHYAYIKEYYPDLYKTIKEKVKQGRIEVQGGMWVEADCNIISGESMVRQFIHGKNFFLDEFGIDVKNLWLPDVFGYSAALPQILKKSGIDYFVTQKISWNQFNRYPHHTFKWRGLDGSEVITHFPPEDNYNSEIRPEAVINARDKFEESAYLDEFLTLFGIGDGGSGPTEEMIETGLRQKDLEGAPRVEYGHAQEMLDRLAEHAGQLPLWVGELYLELHRGTLTTQAYNKKMNRMLELKFRELEILYSIMPLKNYPASQFDTMWKKVLLHQFHDIIPGSSITPVYEDSRVVYEALASEASELKNKAGQLLFKKNENKLTLVNTLSFKYTRPVCIPKEWTDYELIDAKGNIVLSQLEDDQIVFQTEIQPLSVVTLSESDKKRASQEQISGTDYILENDLIRYKFEVNGTISSIYDKELEREVLTNNGKGNLFSYYEDRPANWDAWDIDIFYEKQLLGHPELVSRKWISVGPVRQGIEQELQVGNSTIRQKIYLSSGSKQLDFDTNVDWNENHKMLRVSFEVDITAEQASYEIQYGHVKRNTHRNTSWDMAKFEVVGHRFADLSDRQYGVALLNDCKYGYKIHDKIIDLNLLRSPSNPDPKADRGRHQFTYSLYPHANEMIEADVLSEAAQLNQSPAVFTGFDGSHVQFPVALDSEDVVLEVLKKAEKENALVVRMYEPYGKSCSLNLKLNGKNQKVYETDLLENSVSELDIQNNSVLLKFSAFEIKTLKIIH